jgi:peptide deformylase
MAVRPVLKMGDPILLKVAKPVKKFNTPELETLLNDMHDTMEALDGAGLAAPQIGVSLQVVIFGVKKNPRYPDAEEVPYTVLINPTITHGRWLGRLPLRTRYARIGAALSQHPLSGRRSQGKKN